MKWDAIKLSNDDSKYNSPFIGNGNESSRRSKQIETIDNGDVVGIPLLKFLQQYVMRDVHTISNQIWDNVTSDIFYKTSRFELDFSNLLLNLGKLTSESTECNKYNKFNEDLYNDFKNSYDKFLAITDSVEDLFSGSLNKSNLDVNMSKWGYLQLASELTKSITEFGSRKINCSTSMINLYPHIIYKRVDKDSNSTIAIKMDYNKIKVKIKSQYRPSYNITYTLKNRKICNKKITVIFSNTMNASTLGSQYKYGLVFVPSKDKNTYQSTGEQMYLRYLDILNTERQYNIRLYNTMSDSWRDTTDIINTIISYRDRNQAENKNTNKAVLKIGNGQIKCKIERLSGGTLIRKSNINQVYIDKLFKNTKKIIDASVNSSLVSCNKYKEVTMATISMYDYIIDKALNVEPKHKIKESIVA